MNKILTVAVLLLTAVSTAFSQTKNITVTGHVLEAETKEPAIQANVQLLQLPDSTYVTGIASEVTGRFTLPKVSAGKYVLKISYIGFKNKFIPLQLSASTPTKNVGTVELETDAVLLSEAVVTAEAPQVQVKEDTLVFNSSAYRTPQGAMLEELVKKLPGAEVDDDGNIKINGKDISKIMVNGKEFFGGDVQTGLKNLPVEMVDKLKTYDRQSDMARMTGIDDGEEETVLDLTVKKGMNQGWVMNADVAGGTESRYSARAMVNYFRDNTQFSLMGSANNVNDQGFSGGGGPPRWRRNNGLTATKMIGANFATETDKLEVGGSVRYNYRDNDAISSGYVENFLTNGNSYSNSNSQNRTKRHELNANFRLEWKPDSMTNVLFRPNFSYNKSNSYSGSESGTFEKDPYGAEYGGKNPNDYLSIDELIKLDPVVEASGLTRNTLEDPFKDIRLNVANNKSLNKSNNISADATLILNRKLSTNGRNIGLRLRTSYGDSESDAYSQAITRYYNMTPELDSIYRYNTTPTNNYSYSGELTYSEPIAPKTYLQFSYEFEYSYRESDRHTYDLLQSEGGKDWNIYAPLPGNYLACEDPEQSKYAEYKSYNHEAEVAIRFNREKWNLHAGLSFEPQTTKMSYRKDTYMIDTTRNVFNFSPNVDLRINFSKVSQLRLTYRGRSSQPGMEQLLPIEDNSNPLNVSTGNPGLKPEFTHNLRFFYNDYNADLQRGIMSHVNFSMTQNSISTIRQYDSNTGGWRTQPENINGQWNVFGVLGFNTALPNKKYTINSFSNVNFNNNVGYLTTGQGAEAIVRKNTTTNLSLGERLNAAYRNDWFEFGINGSINYSWEKDKLTPSNNQKPYTFSYGANTQIMTPWNMTLTTNISNQSRRGYSDSSMNRNELIWNAQLSQTFLKGAATVSFEMYDILKQQSNITRSLTSSGRSVYQYNGVNSYCMLHLTYRLNIFGSKEAREKMQQHRNGFGGPGFGGPPPGMGGRRPF